MSTHQPTDTTTGWNLELSYADLPDSLYTQLPPTPVRQPQLFIFNRPLAASLGLDADSLDNAIGAEIFAGNGLAPGSQPIAQAYAGHQFGHLTVLGDGRAHLLGEQVTPDGQRFDIQLKGSGRTPYSRGGDGRAALGPMLREYIISEAMHALGIPTTRSLAVATTGEAVLRDGPLQGAILTRVAASHIRVGTFQWAAMQQDPTALRALADYTLSRHFPDLADTPNPCLALLEGVMKRQAALIAQWLHVGFIHGVMNTDNMALSGETIDYGPCAFMDAYDPSTVFSSIDHRGRYAFGNQPNIALWNLSRFAETLLSLIDPDQDKAIEQAKEVLSKFEPEFQAHWQGGLRAKLGLFEEQDEDADLAQSLLNWMSEKEQDFTNAFRALSQESAQATAPFDHADFKDWHSHWKARLAQQSQQPSEVAALMQSRNPAIIPRNHKVEEALAAATEDRDLGPAERLLAALARPYDHSLPHPGYTDPAPPSDLPYQTFCGT